MFLISYHAEANDETLQFTRHVRPTNQTPHLVPLVLVSLTACQLTVLPDRRIDVHKQQRLSKAEMLMHNLHCEFVRGRIAGGLGGGLKPQSALLVLPFCHLYKKISAESVGKEAKGGNESAEIGSDSPAAVSLQRRSFFS